MLIFDGELGFALWGRVVVICGVLQRRPGIMVTATARGSGVADTHALQHPGRVRRHLQALDGVEILSGLWAKLRCQPHGTLGQQVAHTTTVGRGFNELQDRAIIAKGELTTGTVLR